MASEHDNDYEDVEDEDREGDASDNGRQLRRAAAIAAASGATAFAARKLMQARESGDENGEARNGDSKASRGESHSHAKSLIVAAVSSGWDVAKDTLIPVVEDAAAKAGSYVAKRSPELVRDVVVPNFIDGFEKSRRSGRTRTRRASNTETTDE